MALIKSYRLLPGERCIRVDTDIVSRWENRVNLFSAVTQEYHADEERRIDPVIIRFWHP